MQLPRRTRTIYYLCQSQSRAVNVHPDSCRGAADCRQHSIDSAEICLILCEVRLIAAEVQLNLVREQSIGQEIQVIPVEVQLIGDEIQVIFVEVHLI